MQVVFSYLNYLKSDDGYTEQKGTSKGSNYKQLLPIIIKNWIFILQIMKKNMQCSK